MSVFFTHYVDREDIVLGMHTAGLRIFRKALTPEEWIHKCSPQQALGLAPVLAAIAEESAEARIEDRSVRLSAKLVASLGEAEARVLGLPPTTPLGLQLFSSGGITDSNFTIDARWIRQGGVPVLAKRQGALLHHDGTQHRVAGPLYKLAVWADENITARADAGSNLQRVQSLKEILGEDAPVTLDGYLEELRIFSAAAMSIGLSVKPDGCEVDPILFAREFRNRADSDEIDETNDALLSPADQSLFAEDRFRRFVDVRSMYALRDGSYVHVDTSLQSALEAVKQVQTGTTEARRRFASDPRKAISEFIKSKGLTPAHAEAIATSVFVETVQFSERVKGIDIWRKPVMPWVKTQPNSWLPERFGLRVADDFVTVPAGDARAILAAVQKAMSAGEETASYGDITIPASPQAAAALTSLLNLETAADDRSKADIQSQKDHENPPSQPYFLVVHDNFEDVTYKRLSEQSDQLRIGRTVQQDLLKTTLLTHQIAGTRWLLDAYASSSPGALLADDMGLGKTLQALAFLAQVRHARQPGSKPILIVAPTGLLRSWQAEAKRHLRHDALGKVVEAYGSKLASMRRSETAKQQSEISAGRNLLDTSEWRDAGVVLTTYETMRDYHFSFASHHFLVLVFDEVQKLKNPSSQMAQAARALHGEFVLGLTGTPVENTIHDVWAIMDILAPGFLGSSQSFVKLFPDSDNERLAELHKRLFSPVGDRPPIALRRMKEDHIEGLPKKEIIPQPVTMPPEQALAYSSAVNRALARRSTGDQRQILQTLHELRGISLHPIDPKAPNDDDLDSYIAKSARLSKTIEILEHIRSTNEKALIFCESLDMQARLAALLTRRFQLRREPARINGDIDGPSRQKIVDDFQNAPEGFDVLILSPKAGGVGLTLTAANHVIHLSRWWNPAVEDQSTDRVYRIGQKKTVKVWVPIALHPQYGDASFDSKLHELLERKRSLSKRLLSAPDSDGDVSLLFNEVLQGLARDSTNKDDTLAVPAALRQDNNDENGQHSAWEETQGAIKSVGNEPGSAPIAPPRTPYPAEGKDSAVTPITKPTPDTLVFRFKADGPRNIDQLFHHLRGRKPKTVRYSDRYCLTSPDSRAHLARLVKTLADATSKPDMLEIVCWSPEAFREPQRESEPSQKHHFKGLMTSMGITTPPVAVKIKAKTWQDVQASRRAGDDDHAREMLLCIDGPEPERWLYIFDNSIDGLMTPGRACTVTIIRD